jgi:hypothetical protein
MIFTLKHASEVIPENKAEPRRQSTQLNMFCDLGHTMYLETSVSTTGILIFCNGTPLSWFFK